jgi:HlyD family secretion protein
VVAEVKSKIKKIFNRKIPRFVKIGFVVLLILGAAVSLYIFKFKPASTAVVAQQTARVSKGDLSISITGSGSITSSNRVEITPKVDGTITKVYFKQGDKVKAGDLMFELDDSNAKLNVENVSNNILQAQVSQNTNISDINSLNVIAPFSGQATDISVKAGDVVNKNAPLLTITDQSKLKMTVPFNGTDVNSIKVGQKATVYIQGIMQSVDGNVTDVSGSSYSTSTGGSLYGVEITLNNPGSLKDGINANAEVTTPDGIKASTDNGLLTYINTLVLKTNTGGTVENINVKENDLVNSGKTLIEIKNDDLSVTKSTNDLKLENLQQQLETANKQLGNCKIYSTIDGTIVKQDVNTGDVAKSGQVISTVADAGHMEFSVPIDELDIAKVAVGQNVDVSVDALTETSTRPLSGTVSAIAMEGTPSGGVTTYPVTIKINETDNLKGGMNANAVIYISQKQQVLYVPIEAVTKFGNVAFVRIKSNGTTQSQSGYPGNFSRNQNGGNAAAGNGQANGQAANGQTGTQRNRGAGNNNSNGTAASGGNGGTAASGGNRSSAAGGGNGSTAASGGNGTGRQGTAGLSSAMQAALKKNQAYYANTVMKQVEIGISTDTDIEIVSGLNQGDVVVLPPTVAAKAGTSTTNTNTQRAGGGLGGMGGGGFGGGGGFNRGG